MRTDPKHVAVLVLMRARPPECVLVDAVAQLANSKPTLPVNELRCAHTQTTRHAKNAQRDITSIGAFHRRLNLDLCAVMQRLVRCPLLLWLSLGVCLHYPDSGCNS